VGDQVPNPKELRWSARAAARRAISLVALVALCASLLPACSKSHQPSASDVAAAYLRAWTGRDYTTMATLIDRRSAPFAAFDRKLVSDLGVQRAEHVAGTLSQTKDQATVAVTNRYVIATFGAWSAHGVLRLSHRSGNWLVVWSPQQVATALRPGDRVATTVTWLARAPILGAAGAPLTAGATIVTVGIQGSRVKDRARLTAVLEQSGAAPGAVSGALATAAAHPQWFVPVFDLSEPDYLRLKPTIYPIGGTVFHTHPARAAITTELGAHIVGAVGPITAEQLSHLGSPYVATDAVGRNGIEAAYERQLAGRPGGSVEVVSASGLRIATLATFTAAPGTPVRTTIEPAVQRAAELALASVPGAAAIVAIRASTGAVTASVSHPTSQAFNIALDGQFPPGSTFKVVTTSDLLEHGYTSASVTTCPPTITVDGRVFHNFEGEAAASLTLEQAFALSCNAAFIGLAARLPYASFAATASQFGLGYRLHLGLDTFGGSVPIPTTPTERAATAIGQARVVVSPLGMAAVAAAVDSGAFRAPRLVAGTPDDTVPPKPLDPNVVGALRTMMAAVVANGTAAGQGLPAGTFGKTGTAEFGAANPPATHAWFIGYRGDIAFAVLVVGGGVGGRVAAPIAAAFLGALGAAG
jgi:cell division protein FtsI/penicillin-binding protein 2